MAVHSTEVKMLATQGDIYYHDCPETVSAIIEVVGDFDGLLTVEGHALLSSEAQSTNTWGARELYRTIEGFTGTNEITNDGSSIAKEYIVHTIGQSLKITATELNSGSALVRVTSSHNTAILNGAVSQSSSVNASTTNLDSGNSYTFTGEWERVVQPDVLVNLYADQPTTLLIQFSMDGGTTVHSTITKQGAAGLNEFTTAVKGYRYMRVVVSTDSLTTTDFHLQVDYGTFRQGNLPLSASVSQDADCLLTRTVDSEIDIANGKYVGYSIVTKSGENPDIDSGSVPEDVWGGSSTYTGFPTGAPEEFQVVSTDAGDTGDFTFQYLPSNQSTVYQTATVTLNGTTPVNTGITGYRAHTARYDSGTDTDFNAGIITLRHRTTTANVFLQMQPETSQTYSSGYTVPAGSTAYLRRIFCRVKGATQANLNAAVWVRTLGGSPRLRRGIVAATAAPFIASPYGGIRVSGGSDIVVRVTDVSANNTDVVAGYDILLIKDV